MKYRTLGKTGVKVSELGIGGIGAMGKYGALTPHEFAATMTRAAQLGVSFMDTAPAYGDSEVLFGHYLSSARDSWTVCTKTGYCGGGGSADPIDPRKVIEQCEQSLLRLRVDHVDMLLIHSIDQYGDGPDAVERIRGSGMLDAIRRLREEGKVRFIGISGQLAELVPAVASGEFDVALTYNSFNLLVREADDRLLPLAAELNVGLILGGPFYQGLLSGIAERLAPEKQRWFERQDPGLHQTEDLLLRVRALLEMVGGDARELRRLALRFALSDPRISVAISGMSRPEEVAENAAAVDAGPFSASERRQVDQTLARVPGPTPRWL